MLPRLMGGLACPGGRAALAALLLALVVLQQLAVLPALVIE
jgi:hypothetical protein